MPAVAGLIGGLLGLAYWACESPVPSWVAAAAAIGVGIAIVQERPGSRLETGGLAVAPWLSIPTPGSALVDRRAAWAVPQLWPLAS